MIRCNSGSKIHNSNLRSNKALISSSFKIFHNVKRKDTSSQEDKCQYQKKKTRRFIQKWMKTNIWIIMSAREVIWEMSIVINIYAPQLRLAVIVKNKRERQV